VLPEQGCQVVWIGIALAAPSLGDQPLCGRTRRLLVVVRYRPGAQMRTPVRSQRSPGLFQVR